MKAEQSRPSVDRAKHIFTLRHSGRNESIKGRAVNQQAEARQDVMYRRGGGKKKKSGGAREARGSAGGGRRGRGVVGEAERRKRPSVFSYVLGLDNICRTNFFFHRGEARAGTTSGGERKDAKLRETTLRRGTCSGKI